MWGIDLGGTKIEGVVLGSEGLHDVLFRDRVPTNESKGYEHILQQINRLVRMMDRRCNKCNCQLLSKTVF